MEVWMYGHPDVIPCYALNNGLGKYSEGFESWTPRLMKGVNTQRLKVFGDQKHSWYQKQGRLWEMRYHYGFEPPKSNPFFYGKRIF